MSTANLVTLGHLIHEERQSLLARWRDEVQQLPSAQGLDIPALNDHIPALLDELAHALCRQTDESIEETLIEGSPPIHGRQRFQHGFDIDEVVAEYHILRSCIHELAEERGLVIQGRALQIMNRVIDEAIGLAVQTYAAYRTLEVQQRLAEQLAFVAHDLRTPLSAVSLAATYLDLTTGDAEKDGESKQMLEILKRNVKQLEDLITRVVKENADVQSQVEQRLERRLFDLWPLVQSVFHNLKPVSDTAAINLTNSVPFDLDVYADAELLTRVFQNLLSNAIKYSPRGNVTIEARRLNEAGDVECCVRDDGAGIPADLLDKVFDKSTSDPDREDGFGLGLTIVKELVEAHGGTVRLDSKEGNGATVCFTLPAKNAATPRDTK